MREWYHRHLKPLLPRSWIHRFVQLIETFTPFRVQETKRPRQIFDLPRVFFPFLWARGWMFSLLQQIPRSSCSRIAFVLDLERGDRVGILRTVRSILRQRGSWILILAAEPAIPVPNDSRIIRINDIHAVSELTRCFAEHKIDAVCFVSSGISFLPHYVQQISKAFFQHPETTIIYSDFITRTGRMLGRVVHLPKYLKYFFEHAPYLPSWSCIRRSRWEAAVAFSPTSNREQLLSRCVHGTDPKTILHIPSVTAITDDPIHSPPQAVYIPRGVKSRVSIIIPTNHFSGLLQQCLQSIQKTTQQPHEILIVNNTFDASGNFQKIPRNEAFYTVVDYPQPFNFSAMNNLGARHASGEYFLFLNDDTEAVEQGWMEALVDIAQNTDVGVVGATLLYPDLTVQHAGIYLAHPRFGTSYYLHKHLPAYRKDGSREPGFLNILKSVHEVDAVTGACLLVSKKNFDRLHGFDERLAVGYNDVDLCLRAQQLELACLVTPNAVLLHHESVSRNATSQVAVYRHPEDSAFFIQRWKERLEHNPSLLPAQFRNL